MTRGGTTSVKSFDDLSALEENWRMGSRVDPENPGWEGKKLSIHSRASARGGYPGQDIEHGAFPT